MRQREIHQGTNPATTPGAITRKTAEPAIANAFLVMLHISRSFSRPQWSPDGEFRERQALRPV